MQKIIFPCLLALAAASSTHAQLSAYLPEQGQLLVTPTYQYQTYDDFWLGGGRFSLKTATGFDDQHQHSAFLSLEYGILRDFAADVTIGYTWAEFTDGPADDLTDDGLADTHIGLRYRLVDERKLRYLPTITVRVGGIIAGTYDDAFPFSAGDGANGFETSLLLGRQICPNFGLYGEIGYRWRDRDVPEDVFGAAGLAVSWHGVTLSAGYRHTEGRDGPDIGDPGFGVDFGFPQVREIDQRIEGSLSYTDGGGRNYAVYLARTFEGRNTGEKGIIGASVTIPFGGRAEPQPLPDYKK